MPAPVPARVPVSTYRLQLNRDFTFADARDLVPYLVELGVSELYCSPILAAQPGSSHGYDIVDHRRLNPELGSDEDFLALARTLAENDVGLLLDFVPSHMSIDPVANPLWREVLENGPSAASARFFDIDWDPFVPQLKGKVLLPILRNQYGVELENGRLRIRYDDGVFSLDYDVYNLPLNPGPLARLLAHNLDLLEAELGRDDPYLEEFLSILFHLEHLPPCQGSDPRHAEHRRRETAIVQRRLAAVTQASPRILQHVEDNVRTFNGRPGVPSSFELLHELLEEQVYRLAHWRTATHEINYRRFFDVNNLAGLRMEDPVVFAATHELVLNLIREGRITGLRLDHVDGLFDPAGYFRRLREACSGDTSPIYLVAEKILSTGEPLRRDWPIHGTTGYDFLNIVNGLFVDGSNVERFRRLYARFTGRREAFFDVVYDSKKVIIKTSMASELNVLAHELERVAEENWRSRDITLDSLQDGLKEVVACFPVYRTYIDEEGYTEFDEKSIDMAVAGALRRNPAMERSIFDFIRGTLLPLRRDGQSEQEYERLLQFARKFQQYTGPVQAKGLEDTAFYRYGPLLSLNEVGGDPQQFSRNPEEFHQANRERLASWPLAMLATATHDSKRGEDARARLNVLSEMPDEFRVALSHWARSNAAHRTLVDGEPAPDRNDEYLFYQTLIGTWPPEFSGKATPGYTERLCEYMRKATKEAKIHTSWINPSEAYDRAVADFVTKVLTGPRSERFLRQFIPFQQRVARLGMVNSLSQVVLKVASPGVPDFYQGTELWDLSLVDPDNRRPVDFALRRRLLSRMRPLLSAGVSAQKATAALEEMFDNWVDGRIKLYITAAALRFRRRHPGLFLEGEYIPLEVTGDRSGHLVAFARKTAGEVLIVLAPRLVTWLAAPYQPLPVGRQVWNDTAVILPATLSRLRYQDLFTRQEFQPRPREPQAKLLAGDVLSRCPVAMLAPKPSGGG